MTSRFLYVNAGTPIHRLHPNTKLLGLLLLFVAVMAFNHPAYEGALLALGIVLMAAAGALGNLARSAKFLTLIFVVSSLLWALFAKDIKDPRVVWDIQPALIERGTTPYDLAMVIVIASLLVLAIVLLSLVQLVIRALRTGPGSAGWWVALVAVSLAGIGLLWRGHGLVPHLWLWYSLLGAYYVALSGVVLWRARAPYALALWLALTLVATGMHLALQGFLVHTYSEATLYYWGPSLSISAQALLYGPAMGLRIVAFICFGLLYISTTSPEEMTAGLRAVGMPLTPSIALSLAFRLVPTLAETAGTVMQAQRARGLDVDSGSALARVKRTAPVIVPTLGYALRSADDLTRALETRGLGAAKSRSEYRTHQFGAGDVVAVALCLAVAALCIWLRVALGIGEALPRL